MIKQPDFEFLVNSAKKIVTSLLMNPGTSDIKGKLILLLVMLDKMQKAIVSKQKVEDSGIIFQLLLTLVHLLMSYVTNYKN